MNGFIKFALSIANMPQATIADLEVQLPGISRVADAVKQLEPLLTAADPHIEALVPLALKAYPIVKARWPDIVAATPTVEKLIEFVNSRG
jgi:hypothetical protein